MTKADGNCNRCKGKGFGTWYQENGLCYGCRGKGTYAAQVALKEKAKAEVRRAAEVEEVSILIGPLDSRRDATLAYAHAMFGPEGDGALPYFEQIAPGWFATTVRMHVATVLDWLAKADEPKPAPKARETMLDIIDKEIA